MKYDKNESQFFATVLSVLIVIISLAILPHTPIYVGATLLLLGYIYGAFIFSYNLIKLLLEKYNDKN